MNISKKRDIRAIEKIYTQLKKLGIENDPVMFNMTISNSHDLNRLTMINGSIVCSDKLTNCSVYLFSDEKFCIDSDKCRVFELVDVSKKSKFLTKTETEKTKEIGE